MEAGRRVEVIIVVHLRLRLARRREACAFGVIAHRHFPFELVHE